MVMKDATPLVISGNVCVCIGVTVSLFSVVCFITKYSAFYCHLSQVKKAEME